MSNSRINAMDVSIVITAYNYAHYLEKCLESCLHQVGAGLMYEVIVVDDGSTDETPDVLNRWTDPRFKKFRIPNSGIERASNFGFQQAVGKYIVRVDADDWLLPNYLIEMLTEVKDRNSGFLYPDYQVVGGDGNVIENMDLPEFSPEEIVGRGDFLATGTLFDAAVLRECGGYSTAITNSGLENYELILTLIKKGFQGKHVPRRLFAYRRHALNLSESKKEQIISNGRALFLRMGWGTYMANAYHPYKLKLEAA